MQLSNRLLVYGAALLAFGSSPSWARSSDGAMLAGVTVLSFPPAAPPRTPAATIKSESQQWIPIPDWLSGTWQARSQTVLYSYNCQQQRYVSDQPATIEINRVSTIGVQCDKSGQIWHYTGAPYFRIIDAPQYTERQQIEKMLFVGSSPTTLTLKCRAAVEHIDKLTNETLDSFKEETTTTYESLADGIIRVDFRVKDYDLSGQPRNFSESVCTEKRIKPFQCIDHDERGNLQERFEEFQQSRSRARHQPRR